MSKGQVASQLRKLGLKRKPGGGRSANAQVRLRGTASLLLSEGDTEGLRDHDIVVLSRPLALQNLEELRTAWSEVGVCL